MNVRRFPLLGRLVAAAALALAAGSGLRAGEGLPGSASLAGFYLPGFGPDGNKAWDIQGRESHVDATDESRIEISDLLLRLYSGGNQGRLEMSIKSSHATIKTSNSDTVVTGADILYITGANESYSVSGYNWTWDSVKHTIHLGRNVTVKFNSTANTTSGQPGDAPPHPMLILSDTLDIDQQAGKNQFRFSGNVSVADQNPPSQPGEEFHTTCNQLEVLAIRATTPAAPAAGDADASKLPASLAVTKDSVENIIARDRVVVNQGAMEATGGMAELFPSEEKVVLSDSPQVRVRLSGNTASESNYALLEGPRITWLRGTQVLDIGPQAAAGNPPGQTRVSLPSNSPPQPGAPEPRLVIVGELLHAQFGADQRRFDLEQSVRVEDPRYTVLAQHLDAEFDPPAGSANPPPATPVANNPLLTGQNPAPNLGKLNHLAVSDGVTILQSNLKATTLKAEILPDDQSILLSGGSHVADTLSNATIDAETIKLSSDGDHAEIHGGANQPAQLILPSLPLGESAANIATTILSNTAIMNRGDKNSTFAFSDHVQVKASSLEITSGNLDVLTNNAPGAATDPTQHVQIIQLKARDHVLVTQPGFKASAAQADVNPQVANPKVAGAEAPAANDQTYRMLQLSGDPAGVLGPVRPEVEVPMQNLNLGGTPGAGSTTAKPASANGTAKITSDEQWLFTSPDTNNYVFMGNVSIDGGTFTATCDRMLVNCLPPKASGTTTTAPLTRLVVDDIVSEGHVRLVQGSRISTGDRAVMTPRERKFVLSGNVLVLDNATGRRMDYADIVIQGDQPPQAVPHPGAPGQAIQRPSITIPLSSLHLDDIKKSAEKGSNPAVP